MSTMRLNSQKLNPQVREAAVDWLIAFCEEEVDEAGRQAFNAWLRTSPEHVRAYLRISALWTDADLIDQGQKKSLDELVEQALAESNIVQFAPAERTAEDRRPRRHFRTTGAIAASVTVAILGIVSGVNHLRTTTYSTGIGEQRSLTLADGSQVELNADSSISVKFTDERRLIALEKGQALFRVAKNPARPFIVRTEDTDVKAVGTQFDVYRKAGETVVTVVEGRVAIEERKLMRATSTLPADMALVLLAAGEKVVIRPSAITVPQPANIEATLAWTDGLLMFESTPLEEVAREFNRHNLKPLVIEGQTLRRLEITGVFPASGATRVLDFLQERFGVTVRETGAEIRIAQR